MDLQKSSYTTEFFCTIRDIGGKCISKHAELAISNQRNIVMGNINKAHIEAMKALQNAKNGSEISEENARAVKEAHHKFLEEQNKRNEPEKTEESSSPTSASATSDVQSAYLLSESQRYKRKWITMVVCAICLLLLHGVGIYFLFQHKSNYICSPKPAILMPGTLKFDTVNLDRDVNTEWGKQNSQSIFFRYPVQIGDYDLSLFHIELFQRFILNSRHFSGEEDLVAKQAKELDFKSALVKGLYLIDWDDSYSMSVECSYDPCKGWIEAEQSEHTGGNFIIEQSFIYDLNEQKALSFDDIFPPEQQYRLKDFLRQRLIEEYPYVRTYSDKTLSESGNWDFSLEFKRRKKDNVWYYEFTCQPDLELPRANMILPITIAERGLTNYLSYTPE